MRAIEGRGDGDAVRPPRGAREGVRDDEEEVPAEGAARAEFNAIGVTEAAREEALGVEIGAAVRADRVGEVECGVAEDGGDDLNGASPQLGAKARLEVSLETAGDAADLKGRERGEAGELGGEADGGHEAQVRAYSKAADDLWINGEGCRAERSVMVDAYTRGD